MSFVDHVSRSTGFALSDVTRLLYEPQRSTLAAEFLQAMGDATLRHISFGVLLSGPAGTGKTAVGLLSFLYCAARGLPCVYIPNARDWVVAAQTGRGDEYFLGVFLSQNADLILSDSVLRAALSPALSGGPLDSAMMSRLLSALLARPGPAVGCIFDEVQTISASIAAGLLPGAIPKFQEAAAYFLQWQNWATRLNCFVRMDIASAHGSRELTLPGGEAGRLRILQPWPMAEVTSACSDAECPLFIQPDMRDRAFFVAGGILRLLYRVHTDLSAHRAIDTIDADIRGEMLEHCHLWFSRLSVDEKVSATKQMLPLIRGEIQWQRVKGLYDDGIVARSCVGSTFVEPVSAVAASVVFEVLSTHGRTTFALLSSVEAGEIRGFELERQVLSLLAPSSLLLAAKSLSAAPCVAVSARADVALPVGSVSLHIRAGNVATLFVPLSKQFPCDAITIPAQLSASPIVLWECSVTDPRKQHRVKKVLDWFKKPGGIVAQLRAALPGRPIVCALCWDGVLEVGSKSKFKELDTAAAALSPKGAVRFAVLDADSLRMLGVRC